MTDNKDRNNTFKDVDLVKNPAQVSSVRIPGSISLNMGAYINSDWLNVSGDVDDFIFYDNYKSVSDR